MTHAAVWLPVHVHFSNDIFIVLHGAKNAAVVFKDYFLETFSVHGLTRSKSRMVMPCTPKMPGVTLS